MQDDDEKLISDAWVRCDPSQALEEGDPRYIDLTRYPGVRGSGSVSPTESLRRTLEMTVVGRAPRPSCLLFTGFAGSGKTTELKHLAGRMGSGGAWHVVYIDAEASLNLYAPIRIEHVLAVIATELDGRARALRKETSNAEESYVQRLWRWLSATDVEIKQLGLNAGPVNLSAELKTNESFRQQLEAAVRPRLSAFIEDAKDAIQDSMLKILDATGREQLLVIFDSLEKLTASDPTSQAQVEASSRELFQQHADALHLPCHVVYTFPLWLMFQVTGLGGLYDTEPALLPMIRLYDHDTGERHPPAWGAMEAMLSRRVALDRVLGQQRSALVDTLIEASGGYPRDLIRLMRRILLIVSELPAQPEVVDEVIVELEESYRRLFRGQDLDLLVEIATTHDMPQLNDAQVRRIHDLITNTVILSYRNGRVWYDLHPMLKRERRFKRAWAARSASQG